MKRPEFLRSKTSRGKHVLTFLLRGKQNFAIRWVVPKDVNFPDQIDIALAIQMLESTGQCQQVGIIWENRRRNPRGDILIIRNSAEYPAEGAALVLRACQLTLLRGTGLAVIESRKAAEEFMDAVAAMLREDTAPLGAILGIGSKADDTSSAPETN